MHLSTRTLQIHSQNLDPKIDQQLVDGVLDLLGGKVPEGGDLASKMAAKMVATVGTRSADKLVEDMADDGELHSFSFFHLFTAD